MKCFCDKFKLEKFCILVSRNCSAGVGGHFNKQMQGGKMFAHLAEPVQFSVITNSNHTLDLAASVCLVSRRVVNHYEGLAALDNVNRKIESFA